MSEVETLIANRKYEAGFSTDIETEIVPKGLDEDVVRLISSKKNEPGWLTEWRLAAYRHWLTMTPPLPSVLRTRGTRSWVASRSTNRRPSRSSAVA